MKKTVLLFALLGMVFHAFAQNPNRVALKGIVKDTSGTEMPFATVMLLSPKDSSLINFARANDKGIFEFRSVKNANLLLKISFTGYLPLQEKIGPFTTDAVDLGDVKIKPIAKELLEVVIKAARAPLSIKGDTIEYDARSFKVPPGSTVEDLLRRLPGIEVDAAGNIKAQGKDVKKVLVDGKTFFGEDPKAATKNLGAETISKVQVFNDKSEQSKLTGVDDGKKEKAINLELKDEFKKGSFGKLTGAVGTSERLAGRGNYNRFNKKEQFSVIGYGNNINETGVNWDDYGEFKGNNSWNFDNDDFGFSGGGNYFNFGNDDNAEVPRNNFDGRGFTNNGGAGVNYNFNEKKTKLSTNYFYNQTKLTLDQKINKQTFQPNNTSFFTNDSTYKIDIRRNHRIGLRWEYMADSSNTFITKTNIRFSNSDVNTNQNQRYLSDTKALKNMLGLNNKTLFDAYTVNFSTILRHKFKKHKGSSFAVSVGVNANGSDGTENIGTNNQLFKATTVEEQVSSAKNINESTTKQFKTSLFLLEAVSKKWYWETFYNFSTSKRDIGRGAFNLLNGEQRIDTLSTFYNNQIQFNRVGSSMRYSHDGVNISMGLAVQKYDLTGNYSLIRNSPVIKSIDQNFVTWTPNIDANLELKNNAYLSLNYNYGVKEPSLSDLQPIPNVNNPFYVVTGNPNLLPERNHSLNFWANKFDPSTFMSFNLGINYNLYENQIIATQTIDENRKTTTRPENISGGKQFSTYFYASLPIVKTKLTVNLNGNINANQNPTFINAIRNETQNNGYNINLGFNFTPSAQLFIDMRGGFGINNVEYSIAAQQDQKILRQTVNGSIKWNFTPKLFLETNLAYNAYQNDRFGFNQNIPVWNASVRKLFMKDNKMEVRLAAFDLLNKLQYIRQSASVNYVSQEIAPTLSQYFMLSFSYNVRGFADKLKKNNNGF